MSQLPVNRTTTNSVSDHLSDHNEIHRLHNIWDGFAPANFDAAGTAASSTAALANTLGTASRAQLSDITAAIAAAQATAIATANAYTDSQIGGHTVPGAPTIGTATPGVNQISIAFTAPGSNGGSAILDYTATATSSDGGVTNSATGASSPIVITGLTSNAHYTVTVKARNAVGSSSASSASSSVQVTAPASSINRNAPFNATTSPWNIKSLATQVYQDEYILHHKLDASTRIWYVGGSDQIGQVFVPGGTSGSLQLFYGKTGDPLWSIVVAQFTDLNFNRDRPALTMQVTGPGNSAPSATDTDHPFSMVDPNGTYIDIWRGFVDGVNFIASDRPQDRWFQQQVATSTTSTTLGDTGISFTGSGAAVGDIIFTSDSKYMVVTSVAANTLTGTAGWKRMTTGDAAATPGNIPYMVTRGGGGNASVTYVGTTLTDTVKSGSAAWTTNEWSGGTPRVVVAGTVWGIASANTSNTVTVTAWKNVGTGTAGSTPANGTPYWITDSPGYGTGNIKTDGDTGVGDDITNQNAGGRAANFSWIAGAITGYDCTNGHSTAVASTTLTDTASWQNAHWPVNAFTGYIVTAGSTNGLADVYATITSNTSTALTFSAGWKKVSDNTSATTPPTGSYWITNSLRKISHSLAIAMPPEMLSNAGWTTPATAPDNGGHAGPVTMGMKVGIPSATTKPTTLSFFGSMIWDCAVEYGFYVGDFCGGDKPVFYCDGQSFSTYGNTETGIAPPVWYFFDSGANPDAGPNWDGTGDFTKIEPALRLTSNIPCWLDITPPNGNSGTAYSYTVKATSSHAITYAINSGALPAGLGLNTSTGAITGTPTGGNGTFTLKASDGVGPNVISNSITIAISSLGVISEVHVDQVGALFTGTSGTIFPTTQTTGDFILTIASDVGIASVSDNGGGTWTKVKATNVTSTSTGLGINVGAEIWKSSGGSGISTITMTFNATSSFTQAYASEYNNIGTVDQVFNASDATGTVKSGAGTGGNVTPTNDGSMLVMVAMNKNFVNGTPTNSWNTIGTAGNNTGAYIIQTTKGATQTAFALFGVTATANWASVTAIFNHK